MENNKISSANNFDKDSKFLGRSFMHIKNNKGPSIEPCGTSTRIDGQVEEWSLRTTVWKLLLRKD